MKCKQSLTLGVALKESRRVRATVAVKVATTNIFAITQIAHDDNKRMRVEEQQLKVVGSNLIKIMTVIRIE